MSQDTLPPSPTTIPLSSAECHFFSQMFQEMERLKKSQEEAAKSIIESRGCKFEDGPWRLEVDQAAKRMSLTTAPEAPQEHIH